MIRHIKRTALETRNVADATELRCIQSSTPGDAVAPLLRTPNRTTVLEENKNFEPKLRSENEHQAPGNHAAAAVAANYLQGPWLAPNAPEVASRAKRTATYRTGRHHPKVTLHARAFQETLRLKV